VSSPLEFRVNPAQGYHRTGDRDSAVVFRFGDGRPSFATRRGVSEAGVVVPVKSRGESRYFRQKLPLGKSRRARMLTCYAKQERQEGHILASPGGGVTG
jgi:hypothetical protein